MTLNFDPKAEWLETDGLGGYASGTVGGRRTRRYHALLLTATTPPTGRFVLVNGFDAWVETDGGRFPLTTQMYAPGVIHPDGERRIESFDPDPWPRWSFRFEDGTEVEQEIFVPKGTSAAALSWRLAGRKPAAATLRVRPFISGRDYHALHHENTAFRFDANPLRGRFVWRPYDGVPGVVVLTNGAYEHAPEWYRGFLYQEERARGLEATEDLASPGLLSFDLTQGDAVLILATEGAVSSAGSGAASSAADAIVSGEGGAESILRSLRISEKRRRGRFATPLHRSADAYVVRRGNGKTIVAGYPWFTDWGRDTFIAIRGLCLATGRLEEAREVLVEWSRTVSEGMLPNRFPDGGESPEYNAVDASLWFVIAVHEFVKGVEATGKKVTMRDMKSLRDAIEEILDGYARGTRFGIRLDGDGLIAAGESGVQLTWMDAKVGDRVVTPRIGKPVEVEALWLNALRSASVFSSRWADRFEKGLASFRARFWNEDRGCLYDVVDVDHRRGSVDPTFRPNQIFAVGGLPVALLDGDRARRVVDAVEERLLTPLGLRTLAPDEPGYTPHYEGGPAERDAAYHQGTVWPWLMGPFVEAWVRVRSGTARAKSEARERFLGPLIKHLEEAGLGHVSEIADAEPPHTPRGCPFQAWSMGELMRLDHDVLGDGTVRKGRRETLEKVEV